MSSTEPSDPRLDLVKVLETNDAIQLAMAKGLLEEAGIPFVTRGQIATLIQDVDGFIHKWIRLEVPRECEAKARDLIQALQEPVSAEGIAGE